MTSEASALSGPGYRALHRERHIGARYSGWGHFALTSTVSLAVVALAVWQVRAPSAGELATVPLTFLFANLVEYLGHKGPMHHRRPGLGLVYERHTLQHHHFYTRDCMAAESPRDFQMVLFPPVLLAFFLGAIATPAALVLFALASPNVGWLFVAVAVGYFLTYEWLHFAYHQPPDGFIGRLPLVGVLRRHHAWHHDLARMGRCNFNITFPICDALFGTRYAPPREAG